MTELGPGSSTRAFHSRGVVLPDAVREAWVVVEGGLVAAVLSEAPACDIVECGDGWLAPGYVDTHVHGFAGHDVMDCDPSGIRAIGAGLLAHGTTSWLPTTVTASRERTLAACASVRETFASQAADSVPDAPSVPDVPSARIQGIFLEGPFFTERHCGAQDARYLVDPSVEAFDDWQRAAGGIIRKSALAPERQGSLDYVRALSSRGVTCAIGHTSAAYEQALRAVRAGASVFVHTFNGMEPLLHRAPGVVGCAMTAEGTFAELICDGHHVSPVAADVLVRARGWDHVVLVTDCLSCGGMPDGSYMLGELPIVLEGGVARLRDKGNLAGSTLTLARAVQNVVAWGIATPEQAIRMASEVPARSLGIEGSCGSIRPGLPADLNVLSPDLTPVRTFLSGSEVCIPGARVPLPSTEVPAQTANRAFVS